MRDLDRYLQPRVLQLVGLAGVLASFGFWAWTGRESVLMVTTFGGLAILGRYEHVKRAVRELMSKEDEGA